MNKLLNPSKFHFFTQMVSEPSSALLAYSPELPPTESETFVVVFHSGGATTSASVLSLFGAGFVRLLGTETREDLGGEALTKIVANYLAAEFQR